MQMDVPAELSAETTALIERGLVVRTWRRIPSPIRAVLSGMFVFSMIQNGWFALFLTNVQVAPWMPWSIPLGLVWIGLWFRYFGGAGWPASTSQDRAQAIRSRRVSPAQWAWTGVYFVVFIVFMTCIVNTVYRFQVIPEESFEVSMMPWWTLYPCLLMVSFTAGLSEEAGFRGYMQGGLERRFGPAVAIVVTSLLFWVAHFNHTDGIARWAILIGMALVLGTLTWAADSIWPAILCHAGLDSIAFVLGASDMAPWFMRQPRQIADTGFDLTFVFFCGLLALSLGGGVLILRKIAAANPAAETPAQA